MTGILHLYGCTLRVIYQAQYYFMFPKMYRRARSHLAQDKRAITTDYLLAFFSTMSFSQLQLSYGALPEDYEWSAVQQAWKCRVCNKFASDDHCLSEAHANRVQWYGAAAMQRQQQAPVDGYCTRSIGPRQQVASSSDAPAAAAAAAPVDDCTIRPRKQQ